MDKKQLDKLSSKTIEELEELAKDTRKKIALLRLDKHIGKLKNVRELTSIRHDLARILTVLQQRELEHHSTDVAEEK